MELLLNLLRADVPENSAGHISLEDEVGRGSPLEVDDDQLKAIIKADPLKTTQGVAKDLNFNSPTVFRYLKQIGKMEKFDN